MWALGWAVRRARAVASCKKLDQQQALRATSQHKHPRQVQLEPPPQQRPPPLGTPPTLAHRSVSGSSTPPTAAAAPTWPPAPPPLLPPPPPAHAAHSALAAGPPPAPPATRRRPEGPPAASQPLACGQDTVDGRCCEVLRRSHANGSCSTTALHLPVDGGSHPASPLFRCRDRIRLLLCLAEVVPNPCVTHAQRGASPGLVARPPRLL